MAPSKKTYKVGIIGAGAIAQECHFPGYKKDRRSKVVAFAEPTAERHDEVKERFGKVTGYTNYKDMLKNEDLDIVSICTPNVFHAENAITALKAGCHVLCEKPVATTLKDADRMIAAAKKTRKKLMVGFTHRMFTGTQKTQKMVKDKKIGKTFMIRVRFAHGGPYPSWAKNAWFYNPELAAGGALLDMGIHAIDLALWMMGPIVSVNAMARTLVKKIPVDDNAILQVEFKNGSLGYIEVGWTSQPGFAGVEVYGTDGTLICDYIKGLQLCEGNASAGGDGTVNWKMLDKNPTKGGWDVEIKHWLDVIDGKEKLTMSGITGRNALEVALAAYESSDSGKKVTIG
jgi:UDP-N-acetylglucosamine 3-dehydrogenase